MYITDWIPVCILPASAWCVCVCVCVLGGGGGRGGGGEGGGELSTLYMFGQCTLFRAVLVAFFVAQMYLYLKVFEYFISRLP